MTDPRDPYPGPPQGQQPPYGQQPQSGQQRQYGQQPPEPAYQPVQQPYGQQPPQYAAPPQYGSPYDQQPPWLPQEPPKRSRRGLFVTLLAVVVAAAVAIVLVVVFTNSDNHPSEAKTANRTVSLPEGFGSYKKLDSVDTGTLRSQIAGQLSSLGGGSKVSDNAQVGAYAVDGATPQVIFLAFRVKDVPKLENQVKDEGLSAAVKQFTIGISNGVSGQGGKATSGPKSVDPGKLGGAMRCQDANISEQPVGVCGWGDRSYFALTLVLREPSSSKAGDIARQLREAAEK